MLKSLTTLLILLFCLSCSSTEFGGLSGKKDKDKKDDDPAGDDAGEDAGDDGADDGNIATDDGEGDGGSVKDEFLTSEGQIKAECLEPVIPLPDAVADITVTRHLLPTGAATKSIVTPVVGPLGGSTTVVGVFYSTIYRSPSTVTAFDGKTGVMKWSFATTVTPITPALGDVDNDGENEVVALGADGFVYVIAADGSEKFKSGSPIPTNANDSSTIWSSFIAIGDADGNGKVDILVSDRVFEVDGGLIAKFTLPSNGQLDSIMSDVNGDENLEYISTRAIHDSKTGDALCSFATPIFKMAAGRFAKDDDPVVVGVSSTAQTNPGNPPLGNLIAYRGKDCSQVFSVPMPTKGAGPVNLADYDGDGKLDIGVASYVTFTAFSSTGAVMWKKTTTDTSSSTGATTFDLNGDGKAEVIYNDENNLYVYNGTDGKELYKGASSSATMLNGPIVADIDDDGHADILTPNDSAGTGISVFHAPANDWVRTRRIWNQNAYNPTDVAATGKLFGFDRDNIWRPYLTSGHLLGFRNNLAMRAVKPECKLETDE